LEAAVDKKTGAVTIRLSRVAELLSEWLAGLGEEGPSEQSTLVRQFLSLSRAAIRSEGDPAFRFYSDRIWPKLRGWVPILFFRDSMGEFFVGMADSESASAAAGFNDDWRPVRISTGEPVAWLGSMEAAEQWVAENIPPEQQGDYEVHQPDAEFLRSLFGASCRPERSLDRIFLYLGELDFSPDAAEGLSPIRIVVRRKEPVDEGCWTSLISISVILPLLVSCRSMLNDMSRLDTVIEKLAATPDGVTDLQTVVDMLNEAYGDPDAVSMQDILAVKERIIEILPLFAVYPPATEHTAPYDVHYETSVSENSSGCDAPVLSVPQAPAGTVAGLPCPVAVGETIRPPVGSMIESTGDILLEHPRWPIQIPSGTKGTVTHIDDRGRPRVRWHEFEWPRFPLPLPGETERRGYEVRSFPLEEDKFGLVTVLDSGFVITPEAMDSCGTPAAVSECVRAAAMCLFEKFRCLSFESEFDLCPSPFRLTQKVCVSCGIRLDIYGFEFASAVAAHLDRMISGSEGLRRKITEKFAEDFVKAKVDSRYMKSVKLWRGFRTAARITVQGDSLCAVWSIPNVRPVASAPAPPCEPQLPCAFVADDFPDAEELEAALQEGLDAAVVTESAYQMAADVFRNMRCCCTDFSIDGMFLVTRGGDTVAGDFRTEQDAAEWLCDLLRQQSTTTTTTAPRLADEASTVQCDGGEFTTAYKLSSGLRFSWTLASSYDIERFYDTEHGPGFLAMIIEGVRELLSCNPSSVRKMHEVAREGLRENRSEVGRPESLDEVWDDSCNDPDNPFPEPVIDFLAPWLDPDLIGSRRWSLDIAAEGSQIAGLVVEPDNNAATKTLSQVTLRVASGGGSPAGSDLFVRMENIDTGKRADAFLRVGETERAEAFAIPFSPGDRLSGTVLIADSASAARNIEVQIDFDEGDGGRSSISYVLDAPIEGEHFVGQAPLVPGRPVTATTACVGLASASESDITVRLHNLDTEEMSDVTVAAGRSSVDATLSMRFEPTDRLSMTVLDAPPMPPGIEVLLLGRTDEQVAESAPARTVLRSGFSESPEAGAAVIEPTQVSSEQDITEIRLSAGQFPTGRPLEVTVRNLSSTEYATASLPVASPESSASVHLPVSAGQTVDAIVSQADDGMLTQAASYPADPASTPPPPLRDTLILHDESEAPYGLGSEVTEATVTLTTPSRATPVVVRFENIDTGDREDVTLPAGGTSVTAPVGLVLSSRDQGGLPDATMSVMQDFVNSVGDRSTIEGWPRLLAAYDSATAALAEGLSAGGSCELLREFVDAVKWVGLNNVRDAAWPGPAAGACMSFGSPAEVEAFLSDPLVGSLRLKSRSFPTNIVVFDGLTATQITRVETAAAAHGGTADGGACRMEAAFREAQSLLLQCAGRLRVLAVDAGFGASGITVQWSRQLPPASDIDVSVVSAVTAPAPDPDSQSCDLLNRLEDFVRSGCSQAWEPDEMAGRLNLEFGWPFVTRLADRGLVVWAVVDGSNPASAASNKLTVSAAWPHDTLTPEFLAALPSPTCPTEPEPEQPCELEAMLLDGRDDDVVARVSAAMADSLKSLRFELRNLGDDDGTGLVVCLRTDEDICFLESYPDVVQRILSEFCVLIQTGRRDALRKAVEHANDIREKVRIPSDPDPVSGLGRPAARLDNPRLPEDYLLSALCQTDPILTQGAGGASFVFFGGGRSAMGDYLRGI